ncbi:MAG: hypothetical protein LC775_10920 [Acidobacteria bacterium]|nr:hypothetical protein [Acidobacteriota bacterium]
MIAVTVSAWWRDERRQALQPLSVRGLDAYRGIEGGVLVASRPPPLGQDFSRAMRFPSFTASYAGCIRWFGGIRSMTMATMPAN